MKLIGIGVPNTYHLQPMGFYLRKSISVGPFRFNLSKSGIGVSTGVPGFRLGFGPRGNYVHMGLNGFYYRKTLSSDETRTRQTDVPTMPRYASGDVLMEEIESGDVGSMAHSSSAELLSELSLKQGTLRISPLIWAFAVVLVGALATNYTGPIKMGIGILIAVSMVVLAHTIDALRKSVVLFYDFDETLEKAYSLLHDHALNLASCHGVWHIAAAGNVHDRKYHAGASALVDRKRTTIARQSPDFLKTNVETIAVSVGSQTLFLFPDRILVYDGGRVGAVGYEELEITVEQTRMIESERVPEDAEIVGETWRYVNKKGGPDRRFAHNPTLPICHYEDIHLRTASGLNERLQLSRHGIGKGFAQAVAYLAQFTKHHGQSVQAQ